MAKHDPEEYYHRIENELIHSPGSRLSEEILAKKVHQRWVSECGDDAAEVSTIKEYTAGYSGHDSVDQVIPTVETRTVVGSREIVWLPGIPYKEYAARSGQSNLYVSVKQAAAAVICSSMFCIILAAALELGMLSLSTTLAIFKPAYFAVCASFLTLIGSMALVEHRTEINYWRQRIRHIISSDPRDTDD
jgi:hypothetical protein